MSSLIGIDLGGTNIKGGVVMDCVLKNVQSVPTCASEGGEVTLGALKGIVRSLLESTPRCSGIGVGVPSVVDRRVGVAYNVMNIRGWDEIHLKTILEKEFGLPVNVDNDANCFALGEYRYGRCREIENFVGITLGTGVGGGIIQRGQLLDDANCGSGEFGELPYLDSKLEDYCASRYFTDNYGKTAFELSQAARQGNENALDAYRQYGRHLSVLIKMILYVIDPQAIVLGGSISKSFDLFEQSMMENLNDFAYPGSLKKLRILISDNNECGILGASALCLKY